MGFRNKRHSFTLVELLIVVGIIAILAALLVILLDPAELILQGRDRQRIAETGNIGLQLELARANGVSLGAPNVVYVSIPDTTLAANVTSTCSTIALPELPTGWKYQCASLTDFRRADGAGWLPIDFTKIPGGSFDMALPIDAGNNVTTGNYYSYVTAGDTYALAALLESEKQLREKAFSDGGTDCARYETGTNLQLWTNATGLAGYWKFDEATGNLAADSAGNNYPFVISNTVVRTGGVAGGAFKFSASASPYSFLENGSAAPLYSGGSATAMVWIKPGSAGSGGTDIITQGDLNDSNNYAWSFFVRSDVGSKVALKVQLHNTMGTPFLDVDWTSPALNQDAWAHVATIYEDTARYFVQNGKKENPTAKSSRTQLDQPFGPFAAAHKLRVGMASANAGTRLLNGTIDELRFYKRTVSLPEISACYKATKP